MAALPDLQFRRIDMLEAEKVAGVPFGSLFQTIKGEQVVTALGSLAIQYVIEKRTGATALGWDEWLQDEPDDLDVEASSAPV